MWAAQVLLANIQLTLRFLHKEKAEGGVCKTGVWESQEIKETGFPWGQNSVLVCKEDKVWVWWGIQCLVASTLEYTLGKQMQIPSGCHRQALGGNKVSEEGDLVMGTSVELWEGWQARINYVGKTTTTILYLFLIFKIFFILLTLLLKNCNLNTHTPK